MAYLKNKIINANLQKKESVGANWWKKTKLYLVLTLESKSPVLITIGKMVSIGNTCQSQHILAVQIIGFPFILAGKTASQSNVLVGAIMFLSNTSGPSDTSELRYGKTSEKNLQLVLQRC